MRSTLLIASVLSLSLLGSTVALAGRGGSTLGIEAAVRSGSVDSIVGEVERAEALACLSCIAPVRSLVDHDSPRVREVAGWWLGRRGVRDEVMASMQARLLAQDPVAARNAADVLRGMKDYTALPSLVGYLSHPLDEESGVAAARAIGAIGHPDGLVALKGALASPLAGVRAAAVSEWRNLRAAAGSKTVSDASALMPLLSDADLSVRREAAYTAGYLLDKNAVGALSQVVTSDAAPAVRKAAAWALGQIGSGAAVSALTAATHDTDPLVRSVAMGALGRLK